MQRHAMLEGAGGVLVAVSGGPDSVALLDMLVRMAKTRSSTPVPQLHVAHLDHMLRGRESAEDAEFVRALTDELGLKITSSSIDVRAAALRTGRGIEETAREIRYDFLRAAADDAGCDRIAVGHTMTDQAETFLMRLVRGAGLRGLAAMRPLVTAHTFREVRGKRADNESLPSDFRLPPSALPSLSIIRPLLCITRDEVEAYCRLHRLRFRTDPTNLTLDYTRNRLRTDVLPALGAINPRIVESISRAAEHIAADQEVLDDLALSLLEKARLGSEARPDAEDGTIAVYSLGALLEQKVGMRRRMVIEAIRLARAAANSEECEPGAEVTSVHVGAVDGLMMQKASGRHIVLPGSLEVWLEYDTLVFKAGKITAGYLAAMGSEDGAVEAGGFAFSLQRGLSAGLLSSVIGAFRQEVKTTGRDWMGVALDDRALPEELVIRPRLRGERGQVLGRRRTIKLKKLMIEHRIPSSRRATWPLVTTPDGSYIWSPGLPPAVEFAAHDKSESLAIVRASAI